MLNGRYRLYFPEIIKLKGSLAGSRIFPISRFRRGLVVAAEVEIPSSLE